MIYDKKAKMKIIDTDSPIELYNDVFNELPYIREEGSSHYLVVVNYQEYYGCAEVPIYNISGSGNVKIKEMISGIEYSRNADTMRGVGLTVCLNGFQAQIFKYNY